LPVDAPSSRCLRLRYTGDIVIDGHEFAQGISTCGEVPAPRVSGVIEIDLLAARGVRLRSRIYLARPKVANRS
jgi:hypothetical protein